MDVSLVCNHNVATIAKSLGVTEAARLMREQHVGVRLAVRPLGWEQVAANHFCLGDVDSPQKLAEYQTAKRAHKAALRAASTA